MSEAIALQCEAPGGRIGQWLQFDASIDVERAYRRFVNASAFGWFVLAGAALSLGVMGLWASIARTWALPIGNKSAMSLVVVLVLYGVWLSSLRRTSRRTLMTMLRGRTNLPRTIALAVGVSAVLVFLQGLVYLALQHVGARYPAEYPLPGGPIGAMLLAIIVAPIVEEFTMQAWLQTRLLAYGVLASIVLTTVIFLVIHLPATWYELPRVGVLFALAVLRAWTGSLGACIAMHATSNLLWIGFVLFVFQSHGGHK